MVASVQNKPEHRNVEYHDIPLFPRLIYIELPDNKHKVIGTALFLHNNNRVAILWRIFIKPEYRRKKFATHLMTAAKEHFDEIATDWETQEGYDFCINNGFKRRESNDLRLVWKKEE